MRAVPVTFGATLTPPVGGVVSGPGSGCGSVFGFDCVSVGLIDVAEVGGRVIAESTPRVQVIFAAVPRAKPRKAAFGEAVVTRHVRLRVPCTVIVLSLRTLIFPVAVMRVGG